MSNPRSAQSHWVSSIDSLDDLKKVTQTSDAGSTMSMIVTEIIIRTSGAVRFGWVLIQFESRHPCKKIDIDYDRIALCYGRAKRKAIMMHVIMGQ